MSDPLHLGVLYTDHPTLAAGKQFPSLWSYESGGRGNRQPVAVTADGRREYWLHRSDPLLNTMLPGTHVSLVVNLGGPWASGRSLPATRLLPPLGVIGPFTRPRRLGVGSPVRAAGSGRSPGPSCCVWVRTCARWARSFRRSSRDMCSPYRRQTSWTRSSRSRTCGPATTSRGCTTRWPGGRCLRPSRC